ncbi:PREDICTED: transmembrane protein 126A [Nicrophorus vespilloides]|uniref:Transmembrane protein 126A n=1 Tax=Nicrophorus vespilloides TaxID=110193 RepID=A0ABM1N160_NICVS|nr:PREDICTED: transmembrane protein 126A [Nicrophorus vespilloides]
MALIKGKLSEIPSDAVLLSEKEAVEYQVKLIRNWRYPMDVFAFKYGACLLASSSAAAGIYMNSHYRMKFKLLHYGRVSSYMPIVLLPAALSLILHTEAVLPKLTLGVSCPTCIELRAASLQAAFGGIMPPVLGVLSSVALAVQYGTYNVPYVTREPLKVLQIVTKMTKPISTTIFGIILGQAALAMGVTYFEAKSVHTVNRKLDQWEREFEQNGDKAPPLSP